MHFFTSTTVTAEFDSTGKSFSTSDTAFKTSESLPTPLGSIITLFGEYFSSSSLREASKSPAKEQHIQPEFISLISIPEFFRKPPSIPISPNSFSIIIVLPLSLLPSTSLFINVVFPAPRKPEITSIFVFAIFSPLLSKKQA